MLSMTTCHGNTSMWHAAHLVATESSKLNKNLTATFVTKYGNTREIKIKDSIRQGGVLSVIQYALLIDEINKENTRINQTPNQINTLLWMDNIALISDNIADMEKLLKQTNEIAY